MKRKIFTFLLSACFAAVAMAQAPNVTVKKTAIAPELDGVVDEVWEKASKQSIALPFQTETPTLGEPGQTTWSMLWNDDGVFVLVQVTDDEFYPLYMNPSGTNDWQHDKPEIYFDVNSTELKDGRGARCCGGEAGHYQFAPGFVEAEIDGTLNDDGAEGMHAFKVTGSNYVGEYFMPFTILKDKDGGDLAIGQKVGFDVTIIDGESAAPAVRQRAVWTNDGKGTAANESWNNMDDCGTITLTDYEGALAAQATTLPVLDGVVDEIWATATAYPIDKPFQTETPTVGESGTTTWQALWSEDGLWFLVKVNDDEFYPLYMNPAGTNDWQHDKLELYFDVNTEKKDGGGGQCCGGNKGHYQIAPGFREAEIDGTIQDMGVQGMVAFKVSNPAYVAEYFIPFSYLNDKDGNGMNISQPFGFDVTVIDGESAAPAVRQRAVWMNDGKGPGANESWNNMDDAGLLKLDGAGSASDVENITVVSGGDITTDNGTVQMTATVEPADAMQQVKWVVENGTGRAKIDGKGILTGVVNGTVLVKAISKDGTEVEGKTTVNISGQNVLPKEISYVVNGFFENGSDRAPWTGGTVADGVLVCDPDGSKPNFWDWTTVQQVFVAPEDINEPFTFSFKAWSDSPSTDESNFFNVDFEDPNNGYNRYGFSTHPFAPGGESDWQYAITAEPTMYVFDVVFSEIVENTKQSLQFMLGRNDGPLYLDSITLIKNADLPLLGTSAKVYTNNNKVKLYPNPVQTELTISKIAVPNSKVSVYNAVGQKLMEKTANGTQAKFDVANLRKGMYFVRFSDGTSEKFMKQ